MTVGNHGTDQEYEVEVSVFEGYPAIEDFSSDYFIACGTIDVGKDGLRLDVGGDERSISAWSRGLTAVAVVIDVEEAKRWEVKKVDFYVKHMGRGR